MTEMLEQLAFICVGIAFLVLFVAMWIYFLSNHHLQAWTCVFALAFLGSAIFREVRLRREVAAPVSSIQ